MEEKLLLIEKDTVKMLEKAETAAEIEQLRVKVCGRKGDLTQLLRLLGSLPQEERPAAGQKVNAVREKLEEMMDRAQTELLEKELKDRFEQETLDVTVPGEKIKTGSMHPINLVLQDIKSIFLGMGFSVAEGPEIELDKFNFEMLNIPKDHPARDTQDTFYVANTIVLRTQTSPVQVRTMLQQKPPVRMICPGRVFRSDDVDATHSPMFHQVEGLVVDKGICFADLKGILDEFARRFYGNATKTRFRPGYFPFTEPSAEVDATCAACHGKGCRICKGTGWIEILGCGMVHPNVLRGCGIDPEVYTGYAFGLGLDRITTIKYGISDIRLLFEGDTRFLSQF